MADLNIKVCGMSDPGNLGEVIRLKPDYVGFILYRSSPRFIDMKTVEKLAAIVPGSIKKVGVIVNEPVSTAISLTGKGVFDFLQLHGDETPNYCMELSQHIKIIKAFRIGSGLPENISAYEPYCHTFLFDSAGNSFGGNGVKFNHKILDHYRLRKGFFLSGGISHDDSEIIKSIKSREFHGVDLNSRFEVTPGIKNIPQLKKFIHEIRK